MEEQRFGHLLIRQEWAGDVGAIWEVQREAFGRPEEAGLVDQLRQQQSLALSLVAVWPGQLVGHLAFSPVLLEPPAGPISVLGLGPLAVLPNYQRQGVGAQLVWVGLAHCRQQGHQAMVVLGSPSYYGRFGFVPAGNFGLRSTFDVPAELFMAQELQPGSLAGHQATIHYHPAFSD